MEQKTRTYEAIIWQKESPAPGVRVNVEAKSLEDARQKLESQHGNGTVFDLHNKEDAATSR